MLNKTSAALVSIISPFLNEENFLSEAVESVLCQSYTLWELFLVDDGSTDGSSKLAAGYARKYPDQIFYVQHPGHKNLGVCASRNLGISRAKGIFIAFLDADDTWFPDKLSYQVRILEKHHDLGMVCGPSQYWNSWLNPLLDDPIIQVGAAKEVIIKPPALMTTLYPLGPGAAPCPSGLMVRQNIFDQVGYFESGYFVGQNQLYEDQAFLSKVYLKLPVFISSVCQDRYRQHPTSIVRQAHDSGNYFQIRRYYLNWLKNYLIREQIADPGIWKALKSAYNPYRRQYWDKILHFCSRAKRVGSKVISHLLRKMNSPS